MLLARDTPRYDTPLVGLLHRLQRGRRTHGPRSPSLCTRVAVHPPYCVRAHYKNPLVHVQKGCGGVGKK
ncbi:hypothetical protein INR49_023361 [Caranx melampygus]|nr:hypothetical protein INR49_023361 [Caranx melampygus]